MNAKSQATVNQMISALLDSDGGNFKINFGKGTWAVRVSKTLRILMITITHRFPHPDGRMHSTSKQVQLDVNEGTANIAWVYVLDTVKDLQDHVTKVIPAK